MKTAKQEVAVQEKPTLYPTACVPANVSDFFDESVVTDPKDIMIPRILLMQGTSDLVAQEKARQGEIVDSVSAEVLANSKSPLEFIPIKQLDKDWVIEKFNPAKKKFEFERVDPWDDKYSMQWEFTENGEKFRRNARLSFYVLLAKHVESNHLPYMVSFQRTGYKAGKNIASFFNEAMFAFRKGDHNSIPMAQIFTLGCHMEQGDIGSYYVLDCQRTRASSDLEMEKAKYWFTQLRTKKYEVHAEAEAVEAEGTRQF